MVDKITDLLEVAEFLDVAVFMTATLLFGLAMLMLLKRKK